MIRNQFVKEIKQETMITISLACTYNASNTVAQHEKHPFIKKAPLLGANCLII